MLSSQNNFSNVAYTEIDDEVVDTDTQPQRASLLKYVGMFVACAFISALIVTKLDPTGVESIISSMDTFIFKAHPPPSSTQAQLSDNFEFTLYRNGYNPLDFFLNNSTLATVINYDFLEKYVAIIEPNSDMLVSIPTLDDSKSYSLKFTACPYDSTTGTVSDTNCSYGVIKSAGRQRHLQVSCKAFDEYQVTVEQYDTITDELTSSSTRTAVCMYVRRDIKYLTADDLSATMDAMYALWSTEESDGQALYGENFHSSKWFAEAHMFNAAQRDADHIHEGLGFVTQHIKISNIFELAMQSVNPAVSLPYWDYTYETGVLANSPMFTPDTFGSIKAPYDSSNWQYQYDSLLDAAIPDGRWANAKADLHDGKFPDLINAYGYMRGPWNTNPSPYISRFTIALTSLPSCSNFYTWVQMDSLSDFFDIAPFGPHASTHGAIGGVYGCDIFDELVKQGVIKDETSQLKTCKKWSIILKELYRANFISPKPDCTADSYDRDGISCGYECSETDEGISSMQASLKNLIDGGDSSVGSDDEVWSTWREFVCNGEGHKAFSGDQLEAASPSDPSFWPIHGNLERLFHAKLMIGGFTSNVKWPTSSLDVCDKAKCYEEEYGSKGYYDQCCVGHYEDDQLLDFVNGDVKSGYGPTNKEIMTWTDPKGDYSMPYIYDDFSWSHCSDPFSKYFEAVGTGKAGFASTNAVNEEENSLAYQLTKDV